LRRSRSNRLETIASDGDPQTIELALRWDLLGLHDRGMAWVYILECADGSYYVGSTTDIERRVSQHQLGEVAAYTRWRLPVRLAWCAQFERIDEAFAFEKRVQGWSRRKREALMEGRFEALPGLASRSWAARRGRGELGGGGCFRDRR
jgi:predicted GIY-YIG superfamily endonuclease